MSPKQVSPSSGNIVEQLDVAQIKADILNFDAEADPLLQEEVREARDFLSYLLFTKSDGSVSYIYLDEWHMYRKKRPSEPSFSQIDTFLNQHLRARALLIRIIRDSKAPYQLIKTY